MKSKPKFNIGNLVKCIDSKMANLPKSSACYFSCNEGVPITFIVLATKEEAFTFNELIKICASDEIKNIGDYKSIYLTVINGFDYIICDFENFKISLKQGTKFDIKHVFEEEIIF